MSFSEEKPGAVDKKLTKANLKKQKKSSVFRMHRKSTDVELERSFNSSRLARERPKKESFLDIPDTKHGSFSEVASSASGRVSGRGSLPRSQVVRSSKVARKANSLVEVNENASRSDNLFEDVDKQRTERGSSMMSLKHLKKKNSSSFNMPGSRRKPLKKSPSKHNTSMRDIALGDNFFIEQSPKPLGIINKKKNDETEDESTPPPNYKRVQDVDADSSLMKYTSETNL